MLAVILFQIFVLLDTADIQHTAAGEAQYFQLPPRFQGFTELFAAVAVYLSKRALAKKKKNKKKNHTCLHCPIKLAFFLTVCGFGSCFRTLSVILVSGSFTFFLFFFIYACRFECGALCSVYCVDLFNRAQRMAVLHV